MKENNGEFKFTGLGKAFVRLLLGQGIMEFGDNFRILAVTLLLYELTGSGLAAGFSLLVTPLAGVFLSPLAGALGDKVRGGWALWLLYLAGAILISLFIREERLYVVYTLLVFFACLQAIQEPIYRKLVRDSLNKAQILAGNSLAVGLSGLANLLGPVLGGIGVQLWGMDKVFFISLLCFCISSFVVLSLGGNRDGLKSQKGSFKIKGGLFKEIGEGIIYFWENKPIRKIGFSGFALSFGTTSVNFAFYSLAFEELGVGPKIWGLILSIFYSTRLIAMLVSIMLGNRFAEKTGRSFYLPFFLTSLSWFTYGLSKTLPLIIAALIMEGTSFFFFEISLWSRLQTLSRGDLVARVSGTYNILANGARIMGIIMAFFIMKTFGTRPLFFLNSGLILVFVLYQSPSLWRGPPFADCQEDKIQR